MCGRMENVLLILMCIVAVVHACGQASYLRGGGMLQVVNAAGLNTPTMHVISPGAVHERGVYMSQNELLMSAVVHFTRHFCITWCWGASVPCR